MNKTISACLAPSLFLVLGCSDFSQPPKDAKAQIQAAPKEDTWPGVMPKEDMLVISSAASPQVAYAVHKKNNFLKATVSVESFEPLDMDPAIAVKVGLAADKSLILSEKDAVIRKTDKAMVLEFKAPFEKLVSIDEGWKKFRMGISVDWPGGPFGKPRQRETFLHRGSPRAGHSGLSRNPQDWQPVDIAAFERAMADRRLEIAFDFEQPLDGKATIAIEDEKGRRVRNLVSGQPMAKGTRRIVWDGTDDRGNLVLPSKYRWRSISHPGLNPEYVMSFCDGPGSNHGTLHSAASNGRHLFFGASVSEGGHQLIQLEQDGTFVRGVNAPMGHGLSRVAVAADEKFLYAAYDGMSWGQHVDRRKPDWKADIRITLVKVDLSNGNIVDLSKDRFATITSYSVGPGSPEKLPDRFALAGMALLNGLLYIGDSVKNVVHEVDPAMGGAVLRSIPLANPSALAAADGRLYAAADKKIVEINVAAGKISRKISGVLEAVPAGLAVAADGKFYWSDQHSDVVRIVDKDGKASGMIGKLGGLTGCASSEPLPRMAAKVTSADKRPAIPGPYDPLKLQNPAGIVMSPDGHLWVTENYRWRPKRLSAYDPVKGTMWKEFFGPPAYGSPGASFDPEDISIWFGQGTMFRVCLKEKTAVPISILGGGPGMHYRFWRQDGRTFVISYGKITYINELMEDNTLRPLAFLSSGHRYSYAHSWKPPKEFVEAFKRDYPNIKYEYGVRGHPDHGYGMLWVDRNGDGNVQADEIEFSTAAEMLAGAFWGHDFHDLTMRVPAIVAGKSMMVTLEPEGWWPGGAPRYPALNDAVRAAIPVDGPERSDFETTVDSFGTMIINSPPEMRAFAPDGKMLWSYPNRWYNVHGSHKAPLPSTGELQGILFFTGVAPLDSKGDVMLMNGNHGRAFVMTTDGLYVDEMFPDIRLMTDSWAGGIGILGGEAFGGAFGLSKDDGEYYFQGGGFEYRIYRINGLRETVRGEGSFSVTPEQASAAERVKSRIAAAESKPKSAKIAYMKTPPAIDGRDNDWTGDPAVQWDKDGRFPVSVRASHDGKNLYLFYSVKDASPWVNNGKDWQLLFKTGDSLDLQLSADTDASPARTGPVPGDFRLLVAPFQFENIAVLYRHRLPGAADSVVFHSPWRSETVDSVKKLESAKIAIAKFADSYNVELSVPLSDIGLASTLGGRTLRGDFGVIYGDADGATNIFRNYWSNQATGLVNDVPGEIMLSPNLWGDIRKEALP